MQHWQWFSGGNLSESFGNRITGMRVKVFEGFSMPIYYKGRNIGERRVDFFVEEKIMVELKAIIQLENVHLAQDKNYLEAYNMQVGLLVNFGSQSLQFKRLENQKFVENSLPLNP